jgi:Arc/MetJ-type ribon-helix-helix transcriptional regulator
MSPKRGETISLRLPKAVIDEIDKLVELGLFQSRSDFIREAIRLYIMKYGDLQKSQDNNRDAQ